MTEFDAALELLRTLILDPRFVTLAILLVLAAVIDMRSLRIPNWLTGIGLALGLLFTIGQPPTAVHGVVWALLGVATGLALMVPLWLLRVLGAGDAKLVAAAGAFLGAGDTLYAVLASCVTGAIAAIGWALMHRSLGRLLGNTRASAAGLLLAAHSGIPPLLSLQQQSSGRLPFAASIAVGTIGFVVLKHFGLISWLTH